MESSFPARILIVDDDHDVRESIGQALRAEGYTVEVAASGIEAVEKLERSNFNLMLLDVRMPGLDGMAVAKRAQDIQPGLAIIILTAHATVESAIAAVKSELVVDYLIKPASLQELVAAVSSALGKQALERRPQAPVTAEEFLVRFPLALDRKQRLVNIASSPIRTAYLTPGETAVLTILMHFPDRVCSCRMLAHQALGYDLQEGEARFVIRPYIFRLRQKIEVDASNPELIVTVRGRGYQLSPPPAA
jgi:DNA-binding response OmpR family regulator